eukprot:COSAG02_NODE_4201_length_5632_cov_5.111874_2_plen_102_part_00
MAFTKADALLRERQQQSLPAHVAASLAPGTKIYIKGRGHAEYLGPGESDGGTLEFANGLAARSNNLLLSVPEPSRCCRLCFSVTLFSCSAKVHSGSSPVVL